MAQKRIAARQAATTIGLPFLSLFLLCSSHVIASTTHHITWTIDGLESLKTWGNGRICHPGDLIAFHYRNGENNVARLHSRKKFDSCKADEHADVFNQGGDTFMLAKGENYFISTFFAFCQGGFKLLIIAED